MDDIDPIFSESFRQMITDHFAEGKHFFIGKILTKNASHSSVSPAPTTSNACQVAPSASDRRQNERNREASQQEKEYLLNVNHSHFFNAYGIL